MVTFRRGISWARLLISQRGVSWAAIAIVVAAAVVAVPEAAAGPAPDGLTAPHDLKTVIANLRNVIIGLLVGLATLFATVGGVRYILAGGDPGEVEAAKRTLKYAAIGYGIAVLAPALVTILGNVVGA